MALWRKFSGQSEFNSYLAGWAIAATVMLVTPCLSCKCNLVHNEFFNSLAVTLNVSIR